MWAEFFDRCSFKNEEWREKVLGRREKTEDGGGGSSHSLESKRNSR